MPSRIATRSSVMRRGASVYAAAGPAPAALTGKIQAAAPSWPKRPWRRKRTSQPGATAASGVGAMPNAPNPPAPAGHDIVALEHQPLVPSDRRAGQQAEQATRPPSASGKLDEMRRRARSRRAIQRMELAHRQHVGAAQLIGVAAMRGGIGQRPHHRLRDIGDIDRLELRARAAQHRHDRRIRRSSRRSG